MLDPTLGTMPKQSLRDNSRKNPKEKLEQTERRKKLNSTIDHFLRLFLKDSGAFV